MSDTKIGIHLGREKVLAEGAARGADCVQRILDDGIEDFARVQLRVVEILAAERVPQADKLLQLRVSLGDEQRTARRRRRPYPWFDAWARS